MTQGPDLLACAAWLQAAVPLVPMPMRRPERLEAPPRQHRLPTPCAEGGPHDYPPGNDPRCTQCGATPVENYVAGARRMDAEHALDEAFG